MDLKKEIARDPEIRILQENQALEIQTEDNIRTLGQEE